MDEATSIPSKDDARDIQYAAALPDDPADRLLRRIIAGVAIGHGAAWLTGSIVQLCIGSGWLQPLTNTSYALGNWSSVASMVAGILLATAFVVGGILLISRSSTSIFVLRVAAAGSMILIVAGEARLLAENQYYVRLWSALGSATIQASRVVRGLLLPLLIGLLTLPPLARRIV